MTAHIKKMKHFLAKKAMKTVAENKTRSALKHVFQRPIRQQLAQLPIPKEEERVLIKKELQKREDQESYNQVDIGRKEG